MRRHWMWIAAAVAALAIGGTMLYGGASAQMGGMGMDMATSHPAMGPATPGSNMGPAMQQMRDSDRALMSTRNRMMTELRESDTRLDALVHRMDSATGPRRVEAMAKVLDELVAQRQRMWQGMMAMQPLMMSDMMQHMRTGMMSGMNSAMSSGPMMQGTAMGGMGMGGGAMHGAGPRPQH